jgi:hypothetical protein
LCYVHFRKTVRIRHDKRTTANAAACFDSIDQPQQVTIGSNDADLAYWLRLLWQQFSLERLPLWHKTIQLRVLQEFVDIGNIQYAGLLLSTHVLAERLAALKGGVQLLVGPQQRHLNAPLKPCHAVLGGDLRGHIPSSGLKR